MVSTQEGLGKPQADGEGASSLEKETLDTLQPLVPFGQLGRVQVAQKSQGLRLPPATGVPESPSPPPSEVGSPGGHTRQNGCAPPERQDSQGRKG